MHQPLANTKEMSVSIVIPAFNSSEFLPAAIESVLTQTCSDIEIEIVVIDDGSTDATKVVCDRYPTIKYIYQHHQGLQSARNHGIEVSQGSYLIFLDRDECLLPDAISIGINCLKDRPDAGFVFGRYLFSTISLDRELFEPPPVASYTTLLAAQHHVRCATAICRRVAIESVGGFALDREDLHLFLRIAREFPIYFHDRVVCESRDRAANTSSKAAKMLVQTLDTLSLEWDYIQQHDSARELNAAYECGKATWIKFYGDRFLDREPKCIHQLFEAQVERTPDAIALVFHDRQLTYRELNDRANQLAHHLQSLNVRPETLVGISVERSLETVIGILGILKAGGAYVPLDPAYPQERLAYMLADSQVSVLVTVAHLAASVEAYSGAVVCLDRDLPQIERCSQTNPVSPVTPDNLIYIIYTSGSTGKPKGVLISHANVGRLFTATQDWYHFNDRDVWTLFHSYAFDVSVWELWGALIHGGRLVIIPVEIGRSPQEFYELLARERVTVLNQTPSAFRPLLRVASSAEPKLELSLRLVIFAGEALDFQCLKPWFEIYGDKVPQLVNMYGITETTVHVSYRPIDLTDLDGGSVIGAPIPDLELYILDPQRQPVAIGTTGEMYVGGAGVARGYLNRPELTAERFIAHPWRTDSGEVLYKTGDLARYLPNGDIEYLGRIDNQVKIRGFRIELGEIESALTQNLPVQEAVVIVREDEPGDLRLVAYFVPTTGIPPSVTDIRAALKLQLPDYMMPSAFVRMDAMPLTPNGKIDRQALPVPDLNSLGVGTKFVAADTSTEEILAQIWQEILKLQQVGVEDSFFDLGGNSLLGFKIIERIQDRFRVKVPVVKLYQYFNIRSMAKYLTKVTGGKPTAAVANLPTNSSKSARQVTTDGIAIIGMVGRFPGANRVEELWDNLRAGTESITFFTEDELDPIVDPALRTDPHYVRAKGVIAGAELFDANFFEIGAREAQMMDPQTRIFIELAYEALEDAGYTAGETNKIGVYAGSAENTYFERHLSGRADLLDRFGEFQTHLVNDRDYLPTRAAYQLNLQGPSISISTACSTSLVAIIQAYQGLLHHQCDLALAGGISISTPQNQGYLHQEGSLFTPDGHCRPFDANAQGTLFNNGGGIVVLKRLEEAIAAGDRIYAVIKGVGINNDGADKVSFTAPSIKGQMGAILQAQQEAGIDPETISYIEAHGTATALGDPIEVEALTQAFRTKTSATQFCGIGSIKGNLGHLTAAAGVAGSIKTALALYHRQIPPSINFNRPNPDIDFANSPFYVNDKLVDWHSAGYPRRAGVSSFGVGGTNAHIILEEPPQVIAASATRPYQLLLLSGKTDTAIDRLTTNLHDHLQQHSELNLADVAYTLQQGRKTFSRRRFIVCQDPAEAVENLATLPPHLTATRQSETQNPDVVFMFSGQGSQYVNMGANLYRSEPVFQQTIDSCAEILQPLLDLDLRQLIYPADADAERLAVNTALLCQTRYTQPALFTIEYALAQLWQSWGIQPKALIGHSIGEFVAACLAGVFSLADGLQLVAARGRLMWDLPTGSMLSVRLPAAALSGRLPSEVSIAAINGSNLCVISGPTDAIERLQQQLETEEVACKVLHTSHAFHSLMMAPIVAPLAESIEKIQLFPPQLPLISSVTADWITDEQATNPRYWADCLLQPVRFAEGVQKLWQYNPSCILLEVGPRQSLTTLARQQVTDRTQQVAIASLGTTAEDNADWKCLLQAVGQLWLAGVTIDWQQFYVNEHRHRVPLPTYPFERQKFWIDPLPHRHQSTPSAIDNSISTTTHLQPPMPPAPEPRSVRLMPSIAAIIKATTGVEIGANDSRTTFLELGLDSLALTQVALSLQKKFKVKVTFRQLLEDCSTLAALAQSIDLQLPPDAFTTPVASVAEPAIDLPLTDLAAVVPLPTPAISTGDRNAIESLVQQQLQIMARQLELLGAQPTTVPVDRATVPIAPIAPPIDPAATNGRGNSLSTNGNGKDNSLDTNGNGKGNSSPLPNLPIPALKGPAPGTKISKAIDTSLSPAQQTALTQIIDRYVAKTSESKRQAQAHRRYLADPRTVSGFTPLLKEMVYPIVTNRAQGSKLWDEDGNEYVDLTNGFGLNFFGWSPDFVTDALKAQLDKGIEIGPQTALAGRVAKKISQITGMERVAFCNTGSEAVMAALRIARTVTGRDRIVLFTNSYHGTFDEVLVRAGANLKSLPGAPGVLATAVENILVLDYGTPESLDIIRQYADELAAVIVEPVQGRHPELQPRAFLQQLRAITAESEIALIFDEVVNGFRVAPGGAQEYFGIRADIATYGKVVGGGLPIGILTGAAKYMDALDGGYWQYGDRSIPEVGVTFFAGTFVRHPLALAAVEAVLEKLQAGGPELQISLSKKVDRLVAELQDRCQLVGAQIKIEHFSSWFYLTFPPTEPYGSLLFYLLREQGIHIWEYRPCFLTLAHSDEDIERIIWAVQVSIAELQSAGFLSSSANAIAINKNLPPQPGAKLGKDRDGNPAWFIADPQQPDRYLQIGKSVD